MDVENCNVCNGSPEGCDACNPKGKKPLVRYCACGRALPDGWPSCGDLSCGRFIRKFAVCGQLNDIGGSGVQFGTVEGMAPEDVRAEALDMIDGADILSAWLYEVMPDGFRVLPEDPDRFMIWELA